MNDDGGPYDYPATVTGTISADDVADYRRAAQRIEASGAQLLWVQHEFGIFGGAAGAHLLALLDALTIPVAVTLHTVLANPTPEQRRVMDALVRRASRLIVMADRGRQILLQTYRASPDQIDVIPHGVPDRPLVDTKVKKQPLDLAGHEVLMTFGLLSPGKGIETMIRALPDIVANHPRALYVILGATHPHLLAHEGEAYRDGLRALADELGVAAHVRWIDAFLEIEELLDYLGAADVYVTPYLGAQQMTSGTLAYAVALGVPVVSTPYVHAKELLSGGHGRLVGFGDEGGFAAAINSLLDDPEERERMRRANHALGRGMLWPRLAEATVESLSVLLAEPRRIAALQRPCMPPPASFAAIARLSDDTGILQHCKFGVPDRNHGYCVDDNARALILMQQASDLSDRSYDRWTPIYAAFVQHAWNPGANRFRNFMGFDRQWLEAAGSEDSSARTLWSLGVTARDGREAELRAWATDLLRETLPHALRFTSPRASAFACLAASAMLDAHPGDQGARDLLEDRGRCLAAGLATYATPDWTWFEQSLAYDNARLPEALLCAGRALDRKDWIEQGLAALAWLNGVQRSPSGHFRPVGTESFGVQQVTPSAFDQQPVDAWATIDACATAFRISGEETWRDAALCAWRWFEGDNDAGLPLANPVTGECYDGLGPYGPNRNRGAESVLAFQLANRTIRSLLGDAGPSAGASRPS
jgi:glycosyltransferase involved in cell wall biosynthesis